MDLLPGRQIPVFQSFLGVLLSFLRLYNTKNNGGVFCGENKAPAGIRDTTWLVGIPSNFHKAQHHENEDFTIFGKWQLKSY